MDDTGLGSLRATVEKAEPGDTIIFSPSLDGETILLVSGQLTIDKPLTVDATELLNGLTLDASALSRILLVNDNDPEILFEVTILGLVFKNGFVKFEDGGGIDSHENLRLIECKFENNQASNGGGLRIREDSSAFLSTCSFSENSASLAGGGVYCESSQSMFEKCDFIENRANTGGGLYHRNSDTSLNQCSFEKNNAAGGAAIYNVSSNPKLVGCSFEGGASAFGGALYNITSSPILTNCSFALNRASIFGGAIYNSSSSNPSVTNCTFATNDSGAESGTVHNIDSSTTITNSILWGNSISVSGNPLSAASMNNLIEGNEGTQDPHFSRNPIFITKDYGDLTLLPESPAIDSGNYDAYVQNSGPPQDLRGYIRAWDDTSTSNSGTGSINYLDLGAYEFTPPSGPPTITLIGGSDLVIPFGVTWADPGATTMDGFGGSPDLVISGETIDTMLPRTYTVTYDTTDRIGFPAVQVIRKVTVRASTPLHDWASMNGVSFDSLAQDEDDTPRSLSYLEKFAFGLSPEDHGEPIEFEDGIVTSLGTPWSELSSDQSSPRIDYFVPRRKDASILGLVYNLKSSTNLSDWIEIEMEEVVMASSEEIEVVRFSITSDASTCFVRLSIEFEQL